MRPADLKRPTSGSLMEDTIHNRVWLNQLIDAIQPPGQLSAPRGFGGDTLQLSPEIQEGVVPLKQPTTGIEVTHNRLVGVIPRITALDEKTELDSYVVMEATTGRGMWTYWTGAYSTHADAGIVNASPLPETPFKVRVDPATEYNLIQGCPAGRMKDDTYLDPTQGGLILLTNTDENGEAWVMKDPSLTVEVAIVDGTETVSGILTETKTAVGAVLLPDWGTDDSKLHITDHRLEISLHDEQEEWPDGTYAVLIWRMEEWHIIWASCDPLSALTGLDAKPALLVT